MPTAAAAGNENSIKADKDGGQERRQWQGLKQRRKRAREQNSEPENPADSGGLVDVVI